MAWNGQKYQHQELIPKSITNFGWDGILPLRGMKKLSCFTKFKIKNVDGSYKIYRASPLYCSDSGGVSNVWYDWAIFNINEENIPYHILCFFNIKDNNMETNIC